MQYLYTDQILLNNSPMSSQTYVLELFLPFFSEIIHFNQNFIFTQDVFYLIR